MGLIKFIGRILIVTTIISSAYFHLETPQASLQEFKENYNHIDNIAKQHLKYDIPLDFINWAIPVRIFGVFEVLVVLFIVLGDSLGGALYVLCILGEIFFLVWAKNLVGQLNNWNFNQIEQFLHYLGLLGIGLVLNSKTSTKK